MANFRLLKTDREIKKQLIAHNTDEGIVIADEQDVTDIIEKNKREYNLSLIHI